MTSVDITYFATRCALKWGTVSIKKGTLFWPSALMYIERLNNLPTENEMNRASIMGRNRLTFSVVSSIITARLKDSREYPAITDAAPIIA